MKAFAALFEQLDQTNKTNEKISLLASFLSTEQPNDCLWTIAVFSGRTPPKIVSTSLMRKWAAEIANIPEWLFEETYHQVGDLSETIAGILPAPIYSNNQGLSEWIEEIYHIQSLDPEERKPHLQRIWQTLEQSERFVFNKLSSGSFRVGVSQGILMKALSKAYSIDDNTVAARLMGNWDPRKITLQQLLLDENSSDQYAAPFPFFLASAIEKDFFEKEIVSDWIAEYKWDGIRAQLIHRSNEIFIWSRGEELLTPQFPELHTFLRELPSGTVIDGEILAYKDDKILPFQSLQKRITRKKISKKILEEIPVVLMCYDLLEFEGKDIRNYPLHERRELLNDLVYKTHHNNFMISTSLNFSSWNELSDLQKQSREKDAEGIMLKKVASPYLSGRKKGNWWKWKVQPFTIDAVMIYAQSGHGRRAGLYTDYTFAVFNNDGQLVPFTKAYSGLTDQEIVELDGWIKKNTIEKFGPVRSVHPHQVFEIAFEGIQKSSRHKSGVALRFPRILRWRKDKPASEINTLQDLLMLL